MGVVRIVGIGPVRSAAPVSATIAIGPMAGWVLGPDRCWSMALPSQGGLPLVVDSGLSDDGAGEKPGSPRTAGRRASDPPRPASSRRDGPIPASTLLEGFWLGAEILLADGGWLVAAVSIPALEPLATYHERFVADGHEMAPAPGRLLPEAWESRRREARQKGVIVEPEAWKSIAHWARRLSVDVPDPLTPSQ